MPQKQEPWRFLKLAISKVDAECLQLHHEYGPQFRELTEHLPHETIQPFADFYKESVPADLKDQMSESALHRAAEIMNMMVGVFVQICDGVHWRVILGLCALCNKLLSGLFDTTTISYMNE